MFPENNAGRGIADIQTALPIRICRVLRRQRVEEGLSFAKRHQRASEVPLIIENLGDVVVTLTEAVLPSRIVRGLRRKAFVDRQVFAKLCQRARQITL